MSSAGLSIGELVGTVSLNDTFSGPINDVAKALGVSSESFKAITGFAGVAAGAIVGATGALIALGTRGADVDDVQSAFAGLTARAGETADVMLGALQEGTLGTITNFDLMKMANSVLGTGLVKSSEDMKTLAAGAHLLADRTGGDTATAFQTLTSAMESGRTASLKQLGLFVDNNVAVENYARSIHKNVGDLTDHQRATALSQATLAALRNELNKNGPAAADFGDNINRGKVAVANFTDDLALAIARSPVVAAGFDSMATALQSAFGGTQQDTVKALMGYVNHFVIGLTYVGQGAVTVAGVFVTGWAGIKLVVLGVLTAVSSVGTGLVSLVAGLAQLAGEIPGAGKLVDGFAVGATKLALAMDDVTQGLAAETGEANQALAGHSALQEKLDGLNSSFFLMRDAMEAAANQEADLTAKAPIAPMQSLADAVHLTAAELKALEDATFAALNAMVKLRDDGAQKFQDLQNDLTLANLTGTEARLFEIQLAQAKELAGVQGLALNEPILYQQITDLIIAKYQQQSDAAQGYFASAALFAQNSGFETRDQMEQNVASTLAGYMQMLVSGQYTAKTLKKAWDDYLHARDKLEGEVSLSATQKFELVASSASTILRSLFGKSKTAAIAAVIIDTAAAVVKSLAAYPWPWSLVPAAAAAAAGYAQLQKIQSTDASFAMGTPGTTFENFGRGTSATLHGVEAVVTQRQGSSLAGMVEDSLRIQDAQTVAEIRALRAQMSDRDRALPLLLRDAFQMAMA